MTPRWLTENQQLHSTDTRTEQPLMGALRLSTGTAAGLSGNAMGLPGLRGTLLRERQACGKLPIYAASAQDGIRIDAAKPYALDNERDAYGQGSAAFTRSGLDGVNGGGFIPTGFRGLAVNQWRPDQSRKRGVRHRA